ncbi:polysaccharide deacetylase family protein [Pedobacter sp. SYSU D00535]|uniref:polysaccharide deacetylase family protein n=1 Tax=Pedobacter sp. SYSU D00535 TaxID=2810308 RepID=UPI001A95B29D|nr:polysaccharide deacetylase family protein [Pedobacter sp. SYSU D00535]
MYLVKTPFVLRWIYPSLVWRKKTESKVIYLTFDDGPIPEVTPFVLEALEKYQAKATFFCIGDNIRKHPEVFQAVIDGGHLIGNHTFNHLRGWDTDDDVYLENFQRCQELVQTNYFRPPYGRIKKSQVSKLQEEQPGIKIIMWDVLSGDFDVNLSPEKCLKNVLKHACPGSIIVFHDSIKAFERLEYVLPRALAVWHKLGYRFETL